MDFLRQLFGSSDFMPHGYCYLWNAGLVWLHVVSDALIALAYFTIPVTLLWFVRKRRDLPFNWIFVLFGIFIVACGATHLMEIWNLWHASYWLAGVVKAGTAAASVGTAILLVPLVPKALELPSPSQWLLANAELQKEVHQRRDLELDLRTSEANFREQAELLELTQDAILVRNLEGKILYWNRGAERMYGLKKEEARGKISRSLLQTGFPRPLAEIEKELLERGYWEGELLHRRRDGAVLTVSSRWSLRTDVRGNPLSFLEINRDITERVRALEALKASEERLQMAVESAQLGVWDLDLTTDRAFRSLRHDQIFGYPSLQPEWGVEIAVSHIVPEDRELFRQSLADAITTNGFSMECRINRADDHSLHWISAQGRVYQDSAGKPVRMMGVIADTTQRKEAEKEMERHRLELSCSNAELVSANKELESFSYSVSHDLRAPLRHIDGFTRILKEEHSGGLSPEGLRYLELILAAANHMGHLVDDLLALARIGRKEFVRQKTKLDQVVRQAIADLPPETVEREIEWHIEPLPEMYCDPGLLRLVFSNLLANAVKFSRARRPAVIEVGTRKSDGVTTLFVRDNGVGFDFKYADKLFGVFQRLHRQEDFEGTGVGLATVQRIVHRHGGCIGAESQPDCGATFSFTLGPQSGLPVLQENIEVKLDRI
jgi:PAS domain S-box-containing protein